MKIIVGCEESQAVTLAFREKGHEAYSCDTQECSGGHPEWHIVCDALQVLKGGEFKTQAGTTVYVVRWDLAILHPPCTYISRAGACRMYPTAGNVDPVRLAKAMEAKDFFLSCMNAPVDKIAVENPTPLKIVGLPPHTTFVQPFQYGHPFSKKTLLWLKNLPALVPTEILTEYVPYLPSNTGGAKRGQKFTYRNISQKDSSKTFPGIAKAMAEQWG